MNIVFMSMDTLPSTLWARDLYDQMHIRSDFCKWFPRMCQYGFIEGRDYEYMPRVRLQDEGGRTVQRYVKDYRITQDMAKKLCKLHHTAVGAVYHPQPFDWDALLGLLHKKPPRRSSYEAQLSDSDSLVTTTQIAKEYGCGAKVFNRLLHLHGIQYRANGQWVLYSEHHGKGYTSSLTFRLQRSDGSEVEKLHVDKDRLVRFNGFFPKPQSGTYLILDEGGYQVAGQKGTWMVSDEVEVDGQRFVQMRSEQTKNPPPSIILHESGAFVTQTALGFDGEATRKMRAFLQGPKPELLHHQKFFENGTAERAKESGTEQNYNMIDGCVNNVPKKPRRIGGRWSVLDRLHIKQAERRQKDNTPQQEQERSRKS